MRLCVMQYILALVCLTFAPKLTQGHFQCEQFLMKEVLLPLLRWIIHSGMSNIYFSNFSCRFLNPNNFFQFEFDLRNLQEQSKQCVLACMFLSAVSIFFEHKSSVNKWTVSEWDIFESRCLTVLDSRPSQFFRYQVL